VEIRKSDKMARNGRQELFNKREKMETREGGHRAGLLEFRRGAGSIRVSTANTVPSKERRT